MCMKEYDMCMKEYDMCMKEYDMVDRDHIVVIYQLFCDFNPPTHPRSMSSTL